jgi:hypothetical protein
MRDLMRPVVDHNIEIAERAEERYVRLIAYVDLETFLLEVALRPDVDPDDRGVDSEVLAPQLQGPAMIDPDLKHSWLSATVLLEMRVVDVEIVLPLVNLSPLVGKLPKQLAVAQNDCPKPGDWLPKPPGGCGLPNGPCGAAIGPEGPLIC